jgi:hypothetical protein
MRAMPAAHTSQQGPHFQGGLGRRRMGPATAAGLEEKGAPEGRPAPGGVRQINPTKNVV